jgi:hypothetical protein
MGNENINDDKIEQYYKGRCVHYFKIVSENNDGDIWSEGYKCADCGAEMIRRYKVLERVIKDASGKIIEHYVPK